MRLLYIAEGVIDAPVLLLADVAPADASALITTLRPLASGFTESVVVHPVIDGSPIAPLRLEARVAHRDLGVRLTSRAGTFECGLRRLGWDQVIGLVEPFAIPQHDAGGLRFQYLNADGPITWLVSTGSSW